MRHRHPHAPRAIASMSSLLLAGGLMGAACAAVEPAPEADPAASALPACDPDNGGLTLPDGFCALVVADAVGRARHIVATPDGTLYVAIRGAQDGSGGVVALRDADGDGRAETIERFGDHYGSGIGLRGNYLYVSTDVSVLRYALTDGQAVPAGPPEVVIEGFVEQQADAAKPFTFDDAGNIYVNVGSPRNTCQEKNNEPGSPGVNPCPDLERHAGIWRFPADQTGQVFERDGHRFATGIRNSMGIDWHPDVRAVYVTQHGRGRLSEVWGERFTPEQNADTPSEELLKLEDGINFGFPYCYHDPVQNVRLLNPEYGGDGKTTGDCAQYPLPTYAFPAHLAPNDLMFYTGSQFPERYRGGAFIAFHGSNNRTPFEQQGYQVGFLPLAGDLPAGEWEVFANGFSGAGPIMAPADATARPMGLAQGSDGSLYIADSVQGRIWRVIHRQ